LIDVYPVFNFEGFYKFFKPDSLSKLAKSINSPTQSMVETEGNYKYIRNQYGEI
tara:strand:- start:11417 stop:11578 length:162 start_codon:yes stop_codon:yes gene_type:complete